jgi:hypothetical protein
MDNPSVNVQAEIVNVATAITNAVDCGNKTDAVCAGYKRGSCFQIANTCGGCISGTIGNPQGPGNDPCITVPVIAATLQFTGDYMDNP